MKSSYQLPWLLSFLLSTTITSVVAYDFTCNLFCFNGGQCKFGKGQFGSYSGNGVQTSATVSPVPFAQTDQASGMYCSCPVGYTGLQCEIKFIMCGEDGGGSHTCFNGQECLKDRTAAGKTYYHCECDIANSQMTLHPYAAKYCEHISTTFCGHNANDSGFGSSTAYCSNGGKCKEATLTDQNSGT